MSGTSIAEQQVLEGSGLWDLVSRRAAVSPDLEMACDESARRMTYGELLRRAEETASALHAMGVDQGDVVSWMLPTWLESLVLAAALARLGAVQNPIVPIYRQREVAFCTGQTGAKLLVVPATWRGFDYVDMAERLAAGHAGLQTLVVERGGLPVGDPAGLPPVPAPSRPEEAPVRWLLYTSGTTSEPKGARHVDPSLHAIALAIGERYDVQDRDRVAITFPITHVGGMVWLFSSCQRGAVLLMDEVFDTTRTPEFLSREGCTHAGSATAFHLAYLAAQRRQPGTPLFPGLKSCPGGGAPKPPELHFRVKRELGGAGIVSGWGLTEAPILTTAFHDDSDERLAFTEGGPLPGVELVVVRSDGTRAAPGEVGELRAKAPQMMKGYVDPDLDAEAFDEQGYFRTGDLGTIDEAGYVTISGRSKDVIIRNGENISAKEVEDLLFTLPGVADVAVIGLPHHRTGEQVCAVVALDASTASLSFDQMLAHLRKANIRAQAMPERLEIVDEVLRNINGKVDKRALRERFEEPVV